MPGAKDGANEKRLARKHGNEMNIMQQHKTELGNQLSRVVTQRKALRSALTLVELLVVIVILVTLVGGVLPVLSPNNDSRKIESASRGLKTYFLKAQTRAIRSGRPVGVAFRETSAGSGVALEVYQVENPRAFSGFSSLSTAKFHDPMPNDNTYEYIIEFGEGYGNNFILATEPVIPPRMVRHGDVIQLGNSRFKLFARGQYLDRTAYQETGELFFRATNKFWNTELVSGPAPPTVPINANDIHPSNPDIEYSYPRNYAIDRQPVPTSESPYVLPKGVAIDMHASGIEGGTNPTLLAVNNRDNLKQLSLMFSPAGGIDSIYYNGLRYTEEEIVNNKSQPGAQLTGQPITDATKFVMLLAQVELGGAQIAPDFFNDIDQVDDRWKVQANDTDTRLAEIREEVSWLNRDSRWLVVNSRSGKANVAKNPEMDPRHWEFNKFRNSNEAFAFQQIKKIHRGGNSFVSTDPQGGGL